MKSWRSGMSRKRSRPRGARHHTITRGDTLMRQSISRLIPSKLKRQLRRAYGFLDYNAGILTGRRDPLLPPKGLHSFEDGTHVQIGAQFFQHFVDIAGLKPDERVLDVGCGTGRMARPLTSYLKGGSYDGIDIVAPAIKWCQKTYTPRYPNFRFHFTDLFNKAYNPTGSYQASAYRFPFETSSFDFI